tara:strand:- start:706 stop:1782 length:1077 start_codon:yes stop_codon:yes gene_type:complete
MIKKILILPGDGIGPEVINEAAKVLDKLATEGLKIEVDEGLIGGAAYDALGTPLPKLTLDMAKSADAILLGAVGGAKWETLPMTERPERGLLGLRSELNLFSNLRPAILAPQLVGASTLRPEIVSGLDIMIVRELTSGIYFGEPRGITREPNGKRRGFNTLSYSEDEVARIARIAGKIAMQRNKTICSVDKANVLESTELWREVVTNIIEEEFPDVKLSHMYVDNAAMQLVKNPKQFDVIVTTNLFGDILSDCAAMLTGSIGMLGSASINDRGQGMYEPIHGSAPDIAGKNKANPLATILSVAMMLRYGFNEEGMAKQVESAVDKVLSNGLRTPDIMSLGMTEVGCQEMGDAVISELN